MKNDNHLSVDIETLGKNPDAVVLTIGLSVFNMNGVIHSEQVNLDRTEQSRLGRHIDPETVDWWMRQSDVARADTFPGDGYLSVRSGLSLISALWEQHNLKWAWGLSAQFDLGILEDLHRSVDYRHPWSHRQSMCLRTLSKLRPSVERPKAVTAHSAKSDAIAQAEWAIRMLREI